MIQIFYKDIKSKKMSHISEFRSGSWLHVEDPTSEEIEFLEKKFSLESGMIKDATDIYEVPRLEVEGNIIYVYTRYAYTNEDGSIQTSPILVAVGKDFVISVTTGGFPYLEKVLTLKNGHAIITVEKQKVLMQIFNIIGLSYNSILQNISKKIRAISVEVEKINNKDIIQFVNFETVLNDFLSALVPTNSVLKNLLTGKIINLNHEEHDLMEDVALSNGQLIEIAQSNLRSIVNIREAYSTIMTNNLNRVIKLFTSLTVIMTIPTMIASIYGMNVHLPRGDSPIAFFEIIIGILVITFVLIIIFIRNRWL